jgi:hypothetical protein
MQLKQIQIPIENRIMKEENTVENLHGENIPFEWTGATDPMFYIHHLNHWI